MKILKLLNKKYLAIILILLLSTSIVHAEDPVDIWTTGEKKITDKDTVNENKNGQKKIKNSIFEMQLQKNKASDITQDQTLLSKKIEVVGLYDPAENGLDINMWINSDGQKILKLIDSIDKIDLSKDASEILDIILLTNSYYPSKNISKKQFLEIKSNWLIKKSNLKSIEEYLINNKIVNENPKLARYLVDQYLSRSEIKKSCEIFSKIESFIEDEYLSKFSIYCLINDNQIEQAQLLLDLKKELGFKDKFYEKKISYLMGFEKNLDKEISEKSILDFHLSHRTDPEFSFEPKDSTSELIWKYLSTSNLLFNIKDIDLTDLDKVATIEKATHAKNYNEKELYDLYKRFQFNINQLLNIKKSSKLLTNIETRALIYQGILITSKTEKKLELINALKNSFINENIEDAFDQEMKGFLKEISEEDVPPKYANFYEKYTKKDEIILKKIKINNKILHQSKLLNYFKEKTLVKNIKKDLNDSLKKIKKDKKYYFSTKDIIIVEALKSDGVKISEKYKDLYKLDKSEIPSDISFLIDNEEMGLAMLRIVEVIGQDEVRNIDAETMFFIISTLNQLDIDPIRNKILLKILPLNI